MKITFTETGWEDYLWFQENDPKRLRRINALIKDAIRNPFEGLGKPKPLKAYCPLISPLIANLVTIRGNGCSIKVIIQDLLHGNSPRLMAAYNQHIPPGMNDHQIRPCHQQQPVPMFSYQCSFRFCRLPLIWPLRRKGLRRLCEVIS